MGKPHGLRIRWKGVLALVCALMAALAAIAPRPAHAAAGEYQIYPSVHTIGYTGEGWIMRREANVVVEDGIDADIRACLDEALALKQITGKDAAAVSGAARQLNVLVGVAGSNGPVDAFARELSAAGRLSYGADLFTKTDAYLLASIKGAPDAPDTLLVLGRDTDAFYGLTTLYQILQQVNGLTIQGFTVQDHADVVSRGFIEGYYGNPWSVEDRVNLMTWGGYYKLNAYVYAPKDDPKHRAHWRELYTADEVAGELAPQAEAGNKSKVRFVYALAPFHDEGDARSPFRFDTEKHYQEDLKVLKAKYLQTIDAGVRQIALLADDSRDWGKIYGSESTYLRVLNDLTAWIHELQAEQGEDGGPATRVSKTRSSAARRCGATPAAARPGTRRCPRTCRWS